jgi:hypothetical protein
MFAQPSQVLSIEAQLKLRELHQYVESCRSILDEIGRDLAVVESSPGDCVSLQKVSERLKKLCLEADSWGFSALYQVGTGLQVILLDSGGRIQEQAFWNMLNRGLAMLSALLEQCESDFRWRLAVADTLDSIDQLFYN